MEGNTKVVYGRNHREIQEWRRRYVEPDRILKWHGLNYLLKIPSDLIFCRRRWTYCHAKDRNPFMLPFGIDDSEKAVGEVIDFKNKDGKCTCKLCYKSSEEEEKYGRHKRDYGAKKVNSGSRTHI